MVAMAVNINDSPDARETAIARYLPHIILALAVILVALPSLTSTRIDDIDSAHHIMDGVFFRDFITDLPRSVQDPIAYTLAYYRQYPALGFVFWPPLFPFVEGLFFLAAGSVDLRVARICILAFSLLLAFVAYSVFRRRLPTAGASALAVLLILSTPALAAFYQQVMLEVPALAVALLTVLLYDRTIGRGTTTRKSVALFAVVAAAAVYTKQTVVFIFPALLFDALVNHRAALRQARVWVAGALFAVLLLPLAIFTLTVGKANLEQSVGSDKTYVLNSKAPPDRWSADGWLFYPTRLPKLLNVVVLGLGIGALLYGVANRSFFRRHALWFGWLASWYLLFSYFLNKQDRYAVFWLPAWIFLAAAFLVEMRARYAWRWPAVYLLLAVPVVAGAAGVARIHIDGFEGVDSVVADLIRQEPAGNIVYFGDRHQIFVPFVRKYDPARRIAVLRGNDLLAGSSDILAACRNYRARLIVAEGNGASARLGLDALSLTGQTAVVGTFHVRTQRGPVQFEAFRYTGPIASVQGTVPLGLRNIGNSAAKAISEVHQ